MGFTIHQNKPNQTKQNKQTNNRISNIDLKQEDSIPHVPRNIQDQGSLRVLEYLNNLKSSTILFVVSSRCIDLLTWVLEDLELKVTKGEVSSSQLNQQYFLALEASVGLNYLSEANLILSRGYFEKAGDQFQTKLKELGNLCSKMKFKGMQDLLTKFLQNPQKTGEELKRDLGRIDCHCYFYVQFNSNPNLFHQNRIWNGKKGSRSNFISAGEISWKVGKYSLPTRSGSPNRQRDQVYFPDFFSFPLNILKEICFLSIDSHSARLDTIFLKAVQHSLTTLTALSLDYSHSNLLFCYFSNVDFFFQLFRISETPLKSDDLESFLNWSKQDQRKRILRSYPFHPCSFHLNLIFLKITLCWHTNRYRF